MIAKTLIFAAIAVSVFATEEAPARKDDRIKKDVLLGTLPYGYPAVSSAYAVPSAYLYDDGQYYPGKYEKAYFGAPSVHVPAVSTYTAAVPAVSPYTAAVPAVHYPSYVGSYPYYKSYLYK